MRTLAATTLVRCAVAGFVMMAGTVELAAQATKPGTTNAMKPVGTGEKIPPHQQPRAADAPVSENKTLEQMSAEDKALDQKLRGICRGC